MKRVLCFLLVLGMMAAIFTGCGGGTASSGSASKESVTVAYLGGARGDRSVSDAIYAGFEKAHKDFGIVIKFIELPTDTSKYKAAVLEASESDAALIIGSAGSGLIDEMYAASKTYTDKYYMCLDAPADMKVETSNFIGEMFKQNECSYLVGYLAALMSKTGKVGGIVGVEYPVLSDFLVGYISGAKAANPSIKVATAAIGDFVDSAKAKEIAISQYRLGCDIVYSIAGPAGYGILEAAKDQKQLAIGVDTDQAQEFIGKDEAQANVIITSALKGWGEATYNVIKQFLSDKTAIKWGTVQQLGVKEEGANFADNAIYQKLVSKEIRDKMTALKADIIAGKVVVPTFFGMTAEAYATLKDGVKP